jgi:hypothetical protein
VNKELKAIAMLFPQVFDGEELLPDEFILFLGGST